MRYKSYTLENVYRLLDGDRQGEVINLWLEEGRFSRGGNSNFLKGLKTEEAPRGMVMQNPKLRKKGINRFLKRKGLNFYGRTAKGFTVWYKEFCKSCLL